MKRILALLVAAGLLAAMAVAVYAETASVTITGGTLSVTPANVTLSGVTLDGTDKTSTSAYTANAWTAEDARATGAGWNVTIVATDFTNGGIPLRTIDISSADQEFKIQIEDANITVIAGNTKPASQVTVLTAIPEAPAAALKIVSAAVDTGMGEYNIPPAFELEIPAETYVGTYTSTMTIAINSGP